MRRFRLLGVLAAAAIAVAIGMLIAAAVSTTAGWVIGALVGVTLLPVVAGRREPDDEEA